MYRIMKKIILLSLITALLVNVAEMPAQAASKMEWKKLYAGYLKTIENFEKTYPNGESLLGYRRT